MSDLSRLLDDVYGTSDHPGWGTEPVSDADRRPEPTPEEPEEPEEHRVESDPADALEAIFDLGAAERPAPRTASTPPPASTPVPAPVPTEDPELLELLSFTDEVAEADTERLEAVAGPEPRETVEEHLPPAWVPADDDVLPERGRRRLRLRRRSR